MTQKTIKFFSDEIYSIPPKNNCSTNKTDVYHIDDFWSLDTLELKDFGPENIRDCRYILVVIDNFSKFASTVPLENKVAQTIKNLLKIFSYHPEENHYYLRVID